MHERNRLSKKCQEKNYKEETNKNIENYAHLNGNGESSTDDDDSSSTIPYCIVADYDDGRNSDYYYESTDYARNKNVESKGHDVCDIVCEFLSICFSEENNAYQMDQS